MAEQVDRPVDESEEAQVPGRITGLPPAKVSALLNQRGESTLYQLHARQGEPGLTIQMGAQTPE